MSLLDDLLKKGSLHTPCGTMAKRAALKAKLTNSGATEVVSGDLKLSEGDDRVLEASRVVVKGNLVLEDQSRLLVAGDLEVEGSIIHEGFDYALLFTGGALSAKNLLFHGELVSLGPITVQEVAWTYYNDYSTYADALKARIVVADDRFDAVDDVRADHRLDGHSSVIGPELAKLLRADVVSQDGSWSYEDVAKRLLRKRPLLR
ncbi:hypothetical protein BHS09_08050 [Myxococcus xanthus]|uniref:Uncharacterized protein n=1 Tax=Myxococcus xanthus TaxID=34 RepID=A0AAE6FX06_MYXXA|nr:hypothetical protein [Myxococcus xanthus]QDE66965.1 hypothetical protein BHS09_08050 [Myxococcus xanthus]QDE74238.1 hypothetical protein BHS08_08055 [Myxococcus xanthus]QDF03149.1 hypothetical protein BHS04_07950 [Myxococcus xanthus]